MSIRFLEVVVHYRTMCLFAPGIDFRVLAVPDYRLLLLLVLVAMNNGLVRVEDEFDQLLRMRHWLRQVDGELCDRGSRMGQSACFKG
jgi:hypothetical protein